MVGEVKYRSRDGIIKAILTEIESKHGDARITEIMYRVFLSHYQLKKYIQKLKLAGLVDEIRHGNANSCFALTAKGGKLLEIYREMDQVIPEINYPEQ